MSGYRPIGLILDGDEFENLDPLSQILSVIGEAVMMNVEKFAKDGYGFEVARLPHHGEDYTFDVKKRFYVYVSELSPNGKSYLCESKDVTEEEADKIIDRICSHFPNLVQRYKTED